MFMFDIYQGIGNRYGGNRYGGNRNEKHFLVLDLSREQGTGNRYGGNREHLYQFHKLELLRFEVVISQ